MKNHALWPAIKRLVAREGGYVDHPADAGGPTKFGITQRTLERWRGEPQSAEDVRSLEQSEAERIYWTFWVLDDNLRLDELRPIAFAECVLDTAVLFGPGRAARWAQEAINECVRADEPLKVDGKLGRVTQGRAPFGEWKDLNMAMAARRIEYHAERCVANPSQLVFLLGWIRRALSWRKLQDAT